MHVGASLTECVKNMQIFYFILNFKSNLSRSERCARQQINEWQNSKYKKKVSNIREQKQNREKRWMHSSKAEKEPKTLFASWYAQIARQEMEKKRKGWKKAHAFSVSFSSLYCVVPLLHAECIRLASYPRADFPKNNVQIMNRLCIAHVHRFDSRANKTEHDMFVHGKCIAIAITWKWLNSSHLCVTLDSLRLSERLK